MTREECISFLPTCLQGFTPSDFPKAASFRRGKVRDIIDCGSTLIITTTDRISAFDRILTTIPCKGEVLNTLSLYWFDHTKDIIPNHIVQRVSARSVKVKKCTILPVEVVVRGYLTGSAWRDYQAGKSISGIALPPGLRMNERFATPLITPSTKEAEGSHDLPISCSEVVSRGLMEASVWAKIEKAALSLFARGSEMLAKNGLILVDTKYEFGLLDGELILADEIHTPDSSRFWYADTYRELFEAGRDQRVLDKEYLRQWLLERGFMGNGEAPHIPDDIRIETALRYITAFETITGEKFVPKSDSPEAERKKILSYMM